MPAGMTTRCVSSCNFFYESAKRSGYCMQKKKHRILIADDDHDLVALLRVRLEAEGFETLAAYEGVRTIEMIHKHHPDLVILDLLMPAGTGQTVLKHLRGNSETRSMPVIVLTALGGAHLEKEARAAGAQDFLRKPYDDRELVEKIRNCLTGVS